MSVQRWYFSAEHGALWAQDDGGFIYYADHARIVAEMEQAHAEQMAAIFAFHPEWTVTGMCDPGCLACLRLTELITEREKGYEEGKADAEQAHAAALLTQDQQHMEALAEVQANTDNFIESVAKHESMLAEAKALLASRDEAWDEGYAAGLAAAPRTLTADDPEPAVGSVVLDADGDAWQHVADQDYAGDCWINVHIGFTCKWAAFGRPVTLIHDGEATP